MLRCKDIMNRRVPWISPDGTVIQAAKLMDLHDVGFLPICDAEARPVGVITDRDITIRVLSKDRLAAETRADAVMSAPVQFVWSEQTIDEAGERMRKAGVWRLPVVDPEGHLMGVVSLADVVVHASTDQALAAARRVCSWDIRALAEPPASPPARIAESDGADRESVPIPDTPQENAARVEAEAVVAGRSTGLFKEFPST